MTINGVGAGTHREMYLTRTNMYVEVVATLVREVQCKLSNIKDTRISERLMEVVDLVVDEAFTSCVVHGCSSQALYVTVKMTHKHLELTNTLIYLSHSFGQTWK